MVEKIYRPVCFGNKAIASKPYAKCRACPHFPCYICQRCGRDARAMTLRERGDFKVVCLWCFGKLEKWDRCRMRSQGCSTVKEVTSETTTGCEEVRVHDM